MDHCFDSEELRDIIFGRVTFRKCPDCDKEGRVFADEDGNVITPAQADEEEFPYWEKCEECNGLGYIQNSKE